MQSDNKTNSFFIDVIGINNLDNLVRAVRSQIKVLFGADFLDF